MAALANMAVVVIVAAPVNVAVTANGAVIANVAVEEDCTANRKLVVHFVFLWLPVYEH